MRNGLKTLILFGTVVTLVSCSVWREHAVNSWSDVTGGESLERNFWKEIKTRNWNELSRHLAGNYIAVTPEDGRMDRDTAIERFKTFQLDDYSLGDFQVELNGSTLLITYAITMRGSYKGQPLPALPVHMMTVWQQQKAGWMAIAHSVTGPMEK